MNRFKDKVALVTGGRTGIGLAIAQRLTVEGAKVITAQRKVDPQCDCIKAYFTDPDTPKRVIAEVVERAGRLDVLVNNAGVMQESGIEDMSIQDWQRNLLVNLSAPLSSDPGRAAASSSVTRRDREHWLNRGTWLQSKDMPPIALPSPACTGLHGRWRLITAMRASAATPWRQAGSTPTSTTSLSRASRTPRVSGATLARCIRLGAPAVPKRSRRLSLFLQPKSRGLLQGRYSPSTGEGWPSSVCPDCRCRMRGLS